MLDQRPPPRMARDLIGPALPPGFKTHGAAEDEERDASPGKRPACTLPARPARPFSGPAPLSELRSKA